MPILGAVALIGGGIAAAGSIYGGIEANKSANREASLQQQQGEIALEEAKINAGNEAFNQTHAVQNQRLAFLANGVSLEGSPSMVLESSKAYGQSQVDSILRQGQARKNLAYSEADITRNKGRTAMIGSYFQAGAQVMGSTAQAYNSGMFDPAKKTS